MCESGENFHLGKPLDPKEIAAHMAPVMDLENPTWQAGAVGRAEGCPRTWFVQGVARTHSGGAPQIHGELLKLGIDIGDTTVSKYTHGTVPGWLTSLDNHV